MCKHCAPLIAMFVYAGFTAVTEKLDEIIERLTPPRQPRAHSRRNRSLAARILQPHAPTMFVVPRLRPLRSELRSSSAMSCRLWARCAGCSLAFADADQAREWMRIAPG